MRVERQIELLDGERLALLEWVEGLPLDRISRRPGAGKWSILEIVEHLVAAQRVVFMDFPPLESLVARRPWLKQRFAYRAVWFVLRFKIRVKAPSPKMLPQGEKSLGELRTDWDRGLARIRSYAAEMGADGARRALFRHPIAGPISLTQAVALDRLHVADHRAQIERLAAEG